MVVQQPVGYGTNLRQSTAQTRLTNLDLMLKKVNCRAGHYYCA